MNGYLISTHDQPGLAAKLFEAAASRAVNVFPAYGLADGSNAMMLVGSEDEDGLRAAIADVGLTATPYELVVAELDNRPGTGAEAFRRLAAAGVNLRIAVPLATSGDTVQIALGASNTDALKRALGR
jgi:hypothetical protein